MEQVFAVDVPQLRLGVIDISSLRDDNVELKITPNFLTSNSKP
jgi:hypothetical protein